MTCLLSSSVPRKDVNTWRPNYREALDYVPDQKNRYNRSSSGWLSERPKELVLKTRGRQPRPGGSNPPPSAKVMSRDIVPLMSRDMTFLITRRLKPGPSFLLYTNPDPSFQANHLPTTSALPARYSRLNRAPTESFLLNNSYKMLEFGSRCFSQGARRASADRHIKRVNIELQLEISQA